MTIRPPAGVPDDQEPDLVPHHPRPLALLLATACMFLVLAPSLGRVAAAAPPLPPITISEDMVAAASAKVRVVSEHAAAVAVDLADGTQRWKAGKAQLGGAQQQAAQAQVRADAAEAVALERRRVLGGLVAASYRSPVSVPLALRVGGGAEGLTQALRADADLRQVQGNTQDALAAAQDAEHVADDAERDAQALRDGAATRERALADDLADLQALADRTDRDLGQATGELDRLEAQRAAEIATRETARLAAEQAAREAAAQRAAEAAASAARKLPAVRPSAVRPSAARPFAARPPSPRPSAARPPADSSCAGHSTGGYANGTIPASALCPLAYAPGHRLRADAATAFNLLTEAMKADRGTPVCVTDSYRIYSEQVRLYKEKPDLAAIPGTSNHGWGVAVDLCGGVQDYGTPAYTWMKAHASRYGWIHPAWAEPGRSRQEPWHWEYTG